MEIYISSFRFSYLDMIKQPKVSIIIPLYQITPYFYESVKKCLELDYTNFEIIVGVDKDTKLHFTNKRIKVLTTDKTRTGPAEKRDIGIYKSSAKYIAFLDDDSYPRSDWLSQATSILKNNSTVSAVGGPGLTPPSESFSQQLTGSILSSFFGTGPYAYRFTQQTPRLVDDYPAYNLIVDRKSLLSVSGFGNTFYGGEDTALCIKLINSGKKILYHPDVVVFHHRRAWPLGYLRQVGNVGKHRGYFVKKYPQTSFRLSYFMPALGVLVTQSLLFLSLLDNRMFIFTLESGVSIYLLGVLDAKRKSSWAISLILPFCIYISHFNYSANFLTGLFLTKHLDR